MKKIVDFSKYSSIRIGGEKEVEVIDAKGSYEDLYIIGGCNNILLSPNAPKLAILGKKFDYIYIEDNSLHIGGATKSGKILSYAKKHNLANFELMQKLPGTLGGMLKMNAGLKEWEIFNHLKSITLHSGKVEKKDIDYGYRYAKISDIVYEGVFELSYGFDEDRLNMFKKFRDNQPQKPSCGSCFKNPKGDFAARLIQEVGLKGETFGDMQFSEKHANFLVNLGKGEFQDALDLINLAQKRVYEEFGVRLEREIIIV